MQGQPKEVEVEGQSGTDMRSEVGAGVEIGAIVLDPCED